LTLAMQRFFSGCTSPAEVSNIRLTLAAGLQLQAERLSLEALLAAALLSYTAWLAGEQIVDDPKEVFARLRREFYSNPTVSPWPWHPEAILVSVISLEEDGKEGYQREDLLEECVTNPGLSYIREVYQELVTAEPEDLFK
jgi:hypothetical protein